nr:reverse transcriptase domain-containing protein [Tanacetum cinerariifolium]
MEDFVKRYKLESRDVKGEPECIRISGFMHEITNPELIKCLHDKILKTIDEMMRITTSFLQGEVAASNHERKKSLRRRRKGETSRKDKALAMLIVQPWERVARQKITQSFSPNTEILFPPLDEDEGTEGPMFIEVEIKGHCIHRMADTTTGEDWRRRTLCFGLDELHGCKVMSPYNRIIGRPRVRKLQAVSSTAHGMLKLPVEGGVITQKSSSVPRHIAEHHLNVQEGCSPRLVDKAFHKQIGINLEVYVDDLVIKRHTKDEIVRDIEETFKTLREINMKLNPKKCTFRVEEGMFLRYKVNAKGLKVYPDKVEAVLSLPSPKCLKDVQKLNEKLASLNRFDATNNEAEYEALIAGLRLAKQMGVKNLQANVDSRLVANQVNEMYVAKEADMIRYLEKVRALTSSFKAFSIRQVHRSENKKADALSKLASISFTHLSKQVLVEEIKEKSISEVDILAVVEEERDTKMTPIFEYLKDETLPADVKKARAVRRKSQEFAVINGTLYRKSFLGSWLQCVGSL